MTRNPEKLEGLVKPGISKPPVLLVHGMWSTDETLHELRDAFNEQGYTVEALRLPYHLPKAEHTEVTRAKLARARLEDYVEHIVETVQKQPCPPILVGHSMGALLAQLAAARVPCERLVLLSSAAPAGIIGWGLSVFRTLGTNLLLFPLWERVTELKLENIRYGVANAQSPDLQEEIYDSTTYESGMATFQISMGPILRSRSAAHVQVDRIQCPVLIIGGTEDRITPIRIQRSIAKRFGDQATTIEINGCCHWTIGGKHFPQIRASMFHWLEAMAEA